MAELKVYNGSSWITAIGKTYDGTAWVEKMNFYDGSAQVPLYPTAPASIISIGNIAADWWDEVAPQSQCFRFQRNGQVYRARAVVQGYSAYGGTVYYIATADRYTNCGDDYEVKFVKNSGTVNIDSYTDGTYLQMNQDRHFQITSSGFGTYNGTGTIRKISDTSDFVEFNVSMYIEIE